MTSGMMLKIDVHKVSDRVEENEEKGRHRYEGLSISEIEVFESWERIKKSLRIDDSLATARKITVDARYDFLY